MYCESCGTFIPDGESFCSNCGAKAPLIVGTAAAAAPAPAPAPAPVQTAPVQQVQSAQQVQPTPSAQPGQPVQPTQPAYLTQQAPTAQQQQNYFTGPDGQTIQLAQRVDVPQVQQPVKTTPPLTSLDPNDPNFGRNVLYEVPAREVINPEARAGLICGILGVATYVFFCTNIIPAILGIIFSLKGLKKTEELGGRGNCIAGLILSCSGIVLWVFAISTVIFQKVTGIS